MPGEDLLLAPDTLAGLLARHPGLRCARPEDDARLLRFFHGRDMDTRGFAVSYRRTAPFTGLLACQGDRYEVALAEDAAGEVRGVASVSVRPGFVAGAVEPVGYVGDLRVGFERRTVRQWRGALAEFLERAPRLAGFEGCRWFVAAILDDNVLARRALGHKGRGVQLAPLARFHMRNLLLRVPGLARGVRGSGVRVRRAEAADFEALAAFLDAAARRRLFGWPGILAWRLARWPGLALEDFVLALDAQERIVGCVAPWAPDALKHTRVSRIPGAFRWLGELADRLPGRPPLRVPRAGEDLRILYLTHLELAPDCDRERVLAALVEGVFAEFRSRDPHFFSLADFEGWSLARGLRGIVQQSVPITLYALHAGTPPKPPALREPPAFEMAVV